MIGFQQLNENTSATYNYYPARSTKENKFFVIDMQAETRDVVVTFTTKTKTDVGNRSKRAWFCTVSAMRGKKGGLTIRDVGVQEKFQETIVRLVQEFMLKTRANAVSMRIQRKGSGKMFDMKIKTLFKKLRYPCETTKILNVGDHEMAEDFSFFLITKPGFDSSKLVERQEQTINILASKMASEDDVSSKKTIIVTADMVPGFEEFHDEVKTKWIEDKPARRVTSRELELPTIQPNTRNVYRQRLETSTESESFEVSQLARTALGTLDMPVDLTTLSNRLKPVIDAAAVDPKYAADVSAICKNVLSSRSKEYEQQYTRLSMQMMQDDVYAGLSRVNQSAIARYTGSQYWEVNDMLLTGKSSERSEKIVEQMDESFAEIGINAGNIKPKPLLYRGCEMAGSSVRKIIETGLFASTAYMSSSIDPLVACEFAETSPLSVITSETHGKSDMLDVMTRDKVKVIFIIESDGLPVLIPGKHGQAGECEFIINRNTVFDAQVVQMNSSGTDAIIRLKVKDVGAYNESILSIYQTQERLIELNSIATLMRKTKSDVSNERMAKERCPVTP